MQKMMENLIKKCNKCLEVKGIDQFNKNSSTKDGIQSECKVCSKKRNARYREENPKKIKQNKAKYYKENHKKFKERSLKNYKENSEKIKEKSIKWCKENPEKVKAKNAKVIQELPDYYIKDKLIREGCPEELINNPEFIEVKRLLIKTKRLCRTSRN